MAMVNKKVQIEFADQRIKAIDEIYDIRKAVESASLNLYSRYGIQLQWPMPFDDRVILEVRIPEEMADNFAFGNRLRGISAYLLDKCGGKYDQYRVGKRLLTYTEITGPIVRKDEIPTSEKFEAMATFAFLLERTDEQAEKRIKRIISILNEED